MKESEQNMSEDTINSLNQYAKDIGIEWHMLTRPDGPQVNLIAYVVDEGPTPNMVTSGPVSANDTITVLRFLLAAKILTKLDQQSILERLNSLEEQMAEMRAHSGDQNNAKNCGNDETDSTEEQAPDLEELRARAKAIGTEIYAYGEDRGYAYCRPRFKIPGTRYRFYFLVSNALDPGRKQFRSTYKFAPDELQELARWVEHDEQIFVECNRTYDVKA